MTRRLWPLHDRLVPYVLAAAAVGLLLPDAAARLAAGVPYMLAGQVLGVALTLTIRQFAIVQRRPLPVVTALAVQWTALPLVGIALHQLPADADVSAGVLILAVVPAEITSALIAVLAGGSGALAFACMAGSLAVGTVLTPLWVGALLGPAFHVDQLALVIELALAVAVPLIVGVGMRTLLPSTARLRARALDLSAACVQLVVFVSAGAARQLVLSASLLPSLGLCVALLVAGYVVAMAASSPWRNDAEVRRALVFPISMREFGIAAAVALAVSPSAVGVAGIYGALLMVAAPALAGRMRR